MGILNRIGIEAMRKHFIQELLSLGVKENREGKSIYSMDYDELQQELVLACFREIDITKEDNKWF